jgi:hypothetical protein
MQSVTCDVKYADGDGWDVYLAHRPGASELEWSAGT